MDHFEALHAKINWATARNGGRKVSTILTTRMRLLMVLYWLREKPKFRLLAQKFNVSLGTTHAEVMVCLSSPSLALISSLRTNLFKFVLPKLLVAMQNNICWPRNLRPPGGAFENTMGSIDCTAHLRTRVHPRQAEWYRRDKGIKIAVFVVTPFFRI
jgi:hypothetical protein